MKSFNSMLVIIVVFACLAVTKAQNYSIEEIPSPHSNVSAAELYTGGNDLLYIIGLSDSVSQSEYYDYNSRKLFFAKRSPEGFLRGFNVLDTADEIWGGFTGSYYSFNSSLAENSNENTAVVWSKQRVHWSDGGDSFIDVPVVKFGIAAKNDSFIFKAAFESSESPQVVSDLNNNFHMVRQSVKPLYSLSNPHYYKDSNYHFTKSVIFYNSFDEEGNNISAVNLGNGFSPHIHIDKNNTVHILWLQADSSDSKYFRLLYTKKSGRGFETARVVVDSVRSRWGGMNIYDRFPFYSSFIDDSGTVYAGWTQSNNYDNSTIFLARLRSTGERSVDSLTNQPMLNQSALFEFNSAGVAHVFWRTYIYPSRYFYYSRSASDERIFDKIKDFDSLYSNADNFVLVRNSGGSVNAVYNNYNSINYLVLDNQEDIRVIMEGSGIGEGLYWESPVKRSAVFDGEGHLWILNSKNGINLLKVDQVVTNVNQDNASPEIYFLEQNYPNPFNSTTIIEFSITKPEKILLVVTDILGREVMRLYDDFKKAGRHRIKADFNNLASGVYLYILQAGDIKLYKKMLLIK